MWYFSASSCLSFGFIDGSPDRQVVVAMLVRTGMQEEAGSISRSLLPAAIVFRFLKGP